VGRARTFRRGRGKEGANQEREYKLGNFYLSKTKTTERGLIMVSKYWGPMMRIGGRMKPGGQRQAKRKASEPETKKGRGLLIKGREVKEESSKTTKVSGKGGSSIGPVLHVKILRVSSLGEGEREANTRPHVASHSGKITTQKDIQSRGPRKELSLSWSQEGRRLHSTIPYDGRVYRNIGRKQCFRTRGGGGKSRRYTRKNTTFLLSDGSLGPSEGGFGGDPSRGESLSRPGVGRSCRHHKPLIVGKFLGRT